jgi:hypothetical protein
MFCDLMAIPGNLRTHTVEDVNGRLINMVAGQQLAPGLRRRLTGRSIVTAQGVPTARAA